jgi:hypothetical protein
MFFWIRETIGWALVIFAIVLVSMALRYVGNRQVVEGGVVAATSVAILRTGVLLIRMSTAARLAREPRADG